MIRRRSVLVTIAFLVINPACSNQFAVVAGCASLPVAVSGGIQPTFGWDPDCRIAVLEVALQGPEAVVWSTIAVNQTNSIASPVRYAVAPPGAAQTANFLQPALVRGTGYQVTLFRFPDGGGVLQPAGTETFVP